jgi:soluble lytic murein transglycosylase
MNRVFALLLPILIYIALNAEPAHAASLEPQNYHRAFAALDAGHADLAYSTVTRSHNAVLNKVLRSYYLAAPGNDASFSEIAAFIRENPDWPNLKDIRAIAEQKIPADEPADQVVAWFTAYPPVSLIGVYRMIDALNARGDTQAAGDLIRSHWISGDFKSDELVSYYNRFRGQFYSEDHRARLDRLLWNGDATDARRLYGLFDDGVRTMAEARLALAEQKFGAAAMLARVPQRLQSDPGLLYERLRWLRRNNHAEDADDILDHAPEALGRPEAWWEERQIMIRRAMDRSDYNLAYRLANNNNLTDGKSLLEAEFLAGWLALRFLHQPDDAREHFENLFQHATTPVSRARGAYWLGRSLEELGDKADAQQAYEAAGALSITYYGQLALTRISGQPTIAAFPEPAIPEAVRQRFFNRDIIRAIEMLHEIGEAGRTRTFFKAALDASNERSEFTLLSELAYQIRRPDLAIEAAKTANQKNMMVSAGGFPVFDHHMPSPPEPAFTYALIRQESMFNPDASSPAGAHGLMQLMPHTAKAMAQKVGIKFREQKLDDPDYNLRLGTAFVENQLNSFNGSYILALAGYNAGPSRVREWMEKIGDPRDPRIDPIDWIESVPVPETRNYIQRILENLQVYRARLNGGRAQLLILKDLRR